jgi:F0F1-type ATP synthase assembly protein I
MFPLSYTEKEDVKQNSETAVVVTLGLFLELMAAVLVGMMIHGLKNQYNVYQYHALWPYYQVIRRN